jgi:hypothetical protein
MRTRVHTLESEKRRCNVYAPSHSSSARSSPVRPFSPAGQGTSLAPIAEGGARDGGESDGADSIVAKMRREVAATTDQIQPHHLERKAMLYVRQSSAHQVLHFSDRTLIKSQSAMGNHDCVSVTPRSGNDAIKSSDAERHGSFDRTAAGITHCRGFLERALLTRHCAPLYLKVVGRGISTVTT